MNNIFLRRADFIAAAAEGVYIWGGGGGSGGQKDNYIHTHTRIHNMGYAFKMMECTEVANPLIIS